MSISKIVAGTHYCAKSTSVPWLTESIKLPSREVTRFTLGATVTFLVTVSDITIWNVGALFRGLIAGAAVSVLLERDDFLEPVERTKTCPPT